MPGPGPSADREGDRQPTHGGGEAADRIPQVLRQQEELLRRLSELQRGIAGRRDPHDVLAAIVDLARELLDEDLVAIRLVDSEDPSHAETVATSGGAERLVEPTLVLPSSDGAGGAAMRERRLVLADAASGRVPSAWRSDLSIADPTAAMAAPVYERGEVVGSIVAASRRPGRTYETREQQVLLSLAEYASLALEHARALGEAAHGALRDPLTGLPNRLLFGDRLRHALARAQRSGTPVAVLFCDLDGFKTVNDSLGPTSGDRVLAAVGTRLRECLRPADTVARLGGDEFAILLEELHDRGDAVKAASRVLSALESPLQIDGREVYLGVSIGIAAGDGEPETLLRDADLAMYRAKAEGKGRYAVFEPQMHTAVVERLELEVDLKRALEREELVLVYQPIFNLQSGAIAGLEALVRWRHPTRGLVAPARFVPLAEESGLIHSLGRWVLRSACRQAALWRAKYPALPGLQVAVNLSAAQLREPGLVDEVAEALEVAQLEPAGLTLEITETALMGDLEAAVRRLQALKALGVDLAIDDFGIGYSSLRHLRRYPLDVLKIERTFVEGIGRAGEEPALLRAIVDLAEIFGLRVVAEGIERPEQRSRLLELGCELGQGHLLSLPLGVGEADSLLLQAGLLAGSDPPDARDEAEAVERREER